MTGGAASESVDPRGSPTKKTVNGAPFGPGASAGTTARPAATIFAPRRATAKITSRSCAIVELLNALPTAV